MPKIPRWQIMGLGCVIAVLVVVGVWFYKSQERIQQTQVHNSLYGIAQLKARQISEWRRERLADAAVAMGNPFLSDLLSRWPKHPPVGMEQDLRSLLGSIKKHYDYDHIDVLKPDGRILFCPEEPCAAAVPEVLPGMASAFAQRQPVMLDEHRRPKDGIPYISFIAPIFQKGVPDGKPVCAVILAVRADRHLFPVIQSWPVPSQTAETLLVRRDGNDVLFLNELRHRKNTALKLRISLEQKDVPAVRAVLGEQGIFDGTDYRGHDVLSAILPVERSPWFIVAKMDKKEALKTWRYRSALILALFSGLLVLTFVIGLLLWQRAQKDLYQSKYLVEAALRLEERRHFIVLQSIGDAVIVTDGRGRVELFNPQAEKFTGWPLDEAKGKPLEEVFHIICEETGNPAQNPVGKVLAEGRVVGLANHTLLVSRDGTRRPIDDSAAPVRDEKGLLTGVVLVFRDRSADRKIQSELEQANERLELAQSAAGIGVWDWQRKDNQVRWAPQMHRLLEVDAVASEPLGKIWIKRIHEDDKNRVLSEIEEAIAHQQDVVCEYRVVKPDGTVRWLSTFGKAIYDGSEARRIVGICMDITGRKLAEEQLYLSVRKWQATFNSIKDPVALLDENCTILQCNQAFVDLLGKDAGEIIGRPCFRIMHYREENIDDCPFVRSKRSGTREAMELQIGRRIFNVIVDPMIGWNQSFIGAVHIMQDITERKQMEKTLRESEERYRLIFEGSPSGILIVDSKTKRHVYANPAICAMLGYTQAELRDMMFINIYPADIHEVALIDFERQTVGHKTTAYNIPCIRKDGTVMYSDIGGTKTILDGRECNVGFFTDVTERKKMEDEKEELQAQLMQSHKMESVGRLAGGVAHDFNNMLSIIIGHSELVLARIHPEDSIHADLLSISKAAKRSADLTRQLLAFARKQTIQPKSIDLNDAVEGTLEMLRRLIGEDIRLEWVPQDGLWPVLADAGQIDQMLTNLCINARDAILSTGRITIATENMHFSDDFCQKHPQFMSGDFVLLRVSDTGCGIDKATLAHLFEPFFTTKEIGRGTGLGLATVYGIVKQNSGFISVDSEPGRGTTFKIYLPRHQGAAITKSEEIDTSKTETGRGVILLVEDELSILYVGKQMLEKMGYSVLTANNPGEAQAIADRYAGDIDLLITDVIMPEMNGRDLARLLAVRRPKMKQLFMSGYTADAIAHHGVLDEGIEFMQKPFLMNELSAKIKEMLTK